MLSVFAIVSFILAAASLVFAGGSEIVTGAQSQLNVPYAWGGGHGPTPGVTRGTCVGYIGPPFPCHDDRVTGFDCSGLSRYAIWKGMGFDIGPGNTNSQLNSRHSKIIVRAQLQPGDLIFYGTRRNTHHVAVYSGNNRMIEAPGSNDHVHDAPFRPGDFYVRIH
ncbi:hypothetical protein BGX28_001955 [Mortierella sp. GBA30]|nr:hypothetical protein BGX28_001955 [Mortierella sp. GBA30]